ncbi:LysM peptidoglycan-binding domain-containing protein [Mucilaginibacter terrenus]|uniref:LysM peptidoglycan-binding domain-containing protein n=1 Tax=Mucilaginibacter terrenus TaxID=2482727 RepID=A0A3E2NJP4_9SPHI|nr:lytic transglycosylase domain-containing protein [Mucilaginibacter terrenus]RFZ81217.1 LysM peptidoglycan-binding domain-containing protein [Mucilaginibacter terrenus]
MRRFLILFICMVVLQSLKAQPFQADTSALLPVKEVAVSKYQNVIFKRRLDSIQKDVPLDYNEVVQGYIDLYAGRRDEMGRILGLSQYYFPIYEKAFRDAGVPDEIKYLSVVESALQPNANSRVGAGGLWQFMSETAKIYHLSINDYVDERRDPVLASQAAAAYLKDAYQQFGDWLLAIASYNCGKSNVENALARTGANDYWSIRQLLPAETRGYVPAYIAVTYVMNYYKRHGIYLQASDIPLQNDTVMVNRIVPMSRIAAAVGMDLKEVAVLNPSYRMMIVNGTPSSPRRILVPKSRKDRHAILIQAIDNPNYVIPPYRPVYAPVAQTRALVPAAASSTASPQSAVVTVAGNVPAHHTTVKGETLEDIATKYGLKVDDLLQWNKQLGNSKTVRLMGGLTVNLNRG